MSIFKNENDLRRFVKEMLGGSSVNEDVGEEILDKVKDKGYKSDAERREMVREVRRLEAEIDRDEAGGKPEDKKKIDRVKFLINSLFKEVEMGIYSLANAYQSGPGSTMSDYKGGGSAFNDSESLKSIGVMELIRIIEGGRKKNADGSENPNFGKESFDPDGRGTFFSFVMRCVRGVMLNAHKKEKKHRNDISIDAPRSSGEDGDNGDSLLYNHVFSDSDLSFDAIDGDEHLKFERSEAFEYLMKILKDVTKGNKNTMDVFMDYYGICGHDKLTPTEIGDKLGVSKQRINTIITQTMSKIDAYLIEDESIDGFVLRVEDPNGKEVPKGEHRWAGGPKDYKDLVEKLSNATYLSARLRDMGIKYWEDKGCVVKAYNIDRPIKESVDGIDDIDDMVFSAGTSLDGKKLKDARKVISSMWSRIDSSKIYSDDWWEPIQKFWGLLKENGITFILKKSEYRGGEVGNPQSKVWVMQFPFTNDRGIKSVIVGNAVASGAGSVKDKLSRYDVTFSAY